LVDLSLSNSALSYLMTSSSYPPKSLELELIKS